MALAIAPALAKVLQLTDQNTVETSYFSMATPVKVGTAVYVDSKTVRISALPQPLRMKGLSGIMTSHRDSGYSAGAQIEYENAYADACPEVREHNNAHHGLCFTLTRPA